jgi:peptidoglycan/LPS O-acetylase OafA/YrhL
MADFNHRSANMQAHRKIGDIEILRAIAVSLVVVSHLKSLVYSPGPVAAFIAKNLVLGSGVDLFFVISGFVITRDLIRSFDGAQSTGERWRVSSAFWVRRIFRILPSAWIWMAAFVAISAWFNRFAAAGPISANIGDALAAAGQFANIHWYRCYAGKAECGVNAIFWSLSLEEQFYLILPIFFIFFRHRVVTLAVVAAAAQLFLARPMWSLPWAVRTDGLFIGVLLAFFSLMPAYREALPAWLRGNTARIVALTAVLAVAWNGWLLTPAWPGLLAVIGGTLVWMASYDRGLIVPEGALRRMLLWIGSRSYAIYLIHVPVVAATLELTNRVFDPALIAPGTLNPAMIAFALALTAALADLNFRFVEMPLRRTGTKLSRRIQRRETERAPASMDTDITTITR